MNDSRRPQPTPTTRPPAPDFCSHAGQPHASAIGSPAAAGTICDHAAIVTVVEQAEAVNDWTDEFQEGPENQFETEIAILRVTKNV
jgi:hypothetical protein